MSPFEIFCLTKSNHDDLCAARIWGCPVHMLEPTLQDGKKLPQWQPRSKLGQFVGRSRTHTTSVRLIKNIKAGGMSSQFYVRVFVDLGEHFASIFSLFSRNYRFSVTRISP